MTYNSFLSAGLVDPKLHQAIANHPDSIKMQRLLTQALELRILHQISLVADESFKKEAIKTALNTQSWTDFYEGIKKKNSNFAQNLTESVKRLQFALLNS